MNNLQFSGLRKTLAIGVLTLLPGMAVLAAPTPANINADKAVAIQKINVNAASVEALTMLKGVGNAKAQAIIAYRSKHGKFSSMQDLLAVRGIGEAILAKNSGVILLK